MKNVFPMTGFPKIPDDTITKLIENTGPLTNFVGDAFKGAPDFLLRMAISNDDVFGELFPAARDILASAKLLGIIYTVIDGQMTIDDSSKVTPPVMMNAEAALPFLKIVLCRHVLTTKVLPAKEEPVKVLVRKTVKKSECWCVKDGKPTKNADTGHKCGYMSDNMGVTIVVDNEIEHHPVPCKNGGKCYQKGCLFAH
jgi:hypothetical protein